MIGRVGTRYALRNLFRRPRRTLISVLGAGLGCAIGIFAASWVWGSKEMQIRAASESGAGHIRVVPAGWTDTRENSLRLAGWPETLKAIKALPGVKSFAPRARTNALLAFGNRSAGVEIAGVEPAAEIESNRIVRKGRIAGRYLASGDAGMTVVGKALARRLDVGLGDELHVTLSGREEMRSAMLEIVGIIDSGSRDLDLTICHVALPELERLTGYAGPAEASIMLDDYKMIEDSRDALAGKAGGNEVITWKEVNPGLAANAEGDEAFMNGLAGIIILVVALGIAGAQLAAVMERRREYAILSSLGMRARQITGLIMLEASLVGLGGALVALAIGGPAAFLLATKGFNIEKMWGGQMTIGNVLFDPYIYGNFGVWVLWYALGVCLGATLAASLYPAYLASRTDPAEAIRRI